MSQLRQPGDYLKHNRTGASPPHVHAFTLESNQKVEKENLSKKTQLPSNYEREQLSLNHEREQLSPSSEREQFETASKRVQN